MNPRRFIPIFLLTITVRPLQAMDNKQAPDHPLLYDVSPRSASQSPMHPSPRITAPPNTPAYQQTGLLNQLAINDALEKGLENFMLGTPMHTHRPSLPSIAEEPSYSKHQTQCHISLLWIASGCCVMAYQLHTLAQEFMGSRAEDVQVEQS